MTLNPAVLWTAFDLAEFWLSVHPLDRSESQNDKTQTLYLLTLYLSSHSQRKQKTHTVNKSQRHRAEDQRSGSCQLIINEMKSSFKKKKTIAASLPNLELTFTRTGPGVTQGTTVVIGWGADPCGLLCCSVEETRLDKSGADCELAGGEC